VSFVEDVSVQLKARLRPVSGAAAAKLEDCSKIADEGGGGGIVVEGQRCDRASNPTEGVVVEVGLERTGDVARSTLLSTDGDDEEDEDDVDALCTRRRCSSAIFDCTYARTFSVMSPPGHPGVGPRHAAVGGGRGSSPAAVSADITAGSTNCGNSTAGGGAATGTGSDVTADCDDVIGVT